MCCFHSSCERQYTSRASASATSVARDSATYRWSTGDASSAFSGATGPISRRRSGDRVAVLLVLAGSQQIRHGHFLSDAQAGDLFVFDGEVLSTIDIPRRSRTLTVVGARSRVVGSRDATHGPLDMSLPGHDYFATTSRLLRPPSQVCPTRIARSSPRPLRS